jgi:DNA mismatch repair protein MutL
MQYLFVNGRPVRDKLLLSAVRGGYGDFVPRGRHPMAVAFIALPAEEVDVNVHPAKAEVRFRDAGLVRGVVVSAIRRALEAGGLRTTSALGEAMSYAGGGTGAARSGYAAPNYRTQTFSMRPNSRPGGFADDWQMPLEGVASSGASANTAAAQEPAPDHIRSYPLGAARAQLHETYIVAETDDSVVIVDQHAAHERLVYEKLKTAMADGVVERQILLIPEVVEIEADQAALVAAHAEALEKFGLVLESFGEAAILVREVPALLAKADMKALIRDVAEELDALGSTSRLEDRLHEILSRIACHGSVRAGRILKPQEMDALLREMEATPAAGQCNHGRPTFVELRLADIERLFSRR